MSLTTRRKQATEQDIAHAAQTLFVERGVAETTVEAIAERAEVSVRTFYRYFRSKQDSVIPLLTFGAQRWQNLLNDALQGTSSSRALPEAIEAATREAIAGNGATDAMPFELVRVLLQAAESDTALRAVWLHVNDHSERQLAQILTSGEPPAVAQYTAQQGRLLAAAATTAIRVSIENWALASVQADPQTLAEDAAQVARLMTSAIYLR
ncbi:TetR/AcrR family transcriptional regulator [Hoyosella rhizosphaerae]|uniref:TetR family transcriptional regulator n=1 Tax=Hoyosella rhizosphaerae TaxID=1755582 RepID=A0A916U1L6_9ACTN|nr:TetR/AcrR family transcriptional regulator [Hoyosella rhizosphaerae]MBN4926851.1 TetR/AcrR family transcriptional regulator [Hoyosella rhizosphaerae]GGC56007.1 TetR family transcriptional regulator [Hoyosella rhizosphaerae]